MEEEPIFLEGSPWIKMDGLDWSKLTKEFHPSHMKKGYVFYTQYEVCSSVFIIESGRVAMGISTAGGSMRVVAVLDEGCIFGNQKLFDEMPNSCSAICLSDTCSVYQIPIETAQERVEQSHALIRNMLIQSNRLNRMLLIQIDQMSFGNSESRVCYALYCISEQYSEDVGNDLEEKKIRMHFTHQNVADVTGLSRVSVSNVFSKLMQEGIISRENGTYYVKNTELLKKKVSSGK